MSQGLESIILMSMRSPFLDDSKIYCPMANLYLKSFVNANAPNTEIVLGDDDYDPNNLDKFERFSAVGISVMTPQRDEMMRFIDAYSKRFPSKPIIVGGPHVKHYTDEVAAISSVTYVVPFDGERPLTDICNGVATDRVLVVKMSKDDIRNAPRPDRTSENACEVIKRYHYRLTDRDGNNREATTMMTSRGCPMGCKFCEDAKTISKWSAESNLKAEMDDIKALGYKGVYLFDDLFAIALPIVRPIAEELRKRDLIYRCNGQANFFTKWGEDFAKLLGETGCVEIAFGHESGSQKILDNVDKRTMVTQNYKSVEWAKKHGIKVKSFLMLGLPGEDDETVRATEEFIATAGMDDFQLAVYYPYKGTQIRDAIDRGDQSMDLIFEGEGLGAYGQKGGSSESVVRTTRFTSKELLQIRDELVNKYKPKSHKAKWQEDMFFDTAHKDEMSGCGSRAKPTSLTIGVKKQ